MSKITVYQFMIYDAANGQMRKSCRWATRERIDWLHGEVLEHTAVQVDAQLIGGEIDAMSAINFDPHAVVGFQRQAR